MVRTKNWVIDESTFPKDKDIESQLQFLIKYAILAPSPRNSQPWKFKIKNNSITILPDNKRKLKIADKSKRELWISLGCALKNILLAGEHFGLKGTEQITERQIKITFKKSKPKKNYLFNYITKRATNRRKAKRALIKKEELTKLKKLPFEKSTNAFLIDDRKNIDKILQLSNISNKKKFDDKDYKKEYISCIRFNKKTTNKTNDGIPYYSMDLPTLPTKIGKRIMNYFLNGDYENKLTKERLKTSSGIIIITSKLDSKKHWVKTGKTLQNILLLLTSLNINYAFIATLCQVKKTRTELNKTLKGLPQIVLRIGQAKDIAHTRRRPTEEITNINQ